MTTYSLASTLPDDTFADWTTSALWQGGHVPNDPSAQVYLNKAGGNFYFVEVGQGEHISIGSLNMQSNDLLIYGALVSAGSVTVASPADIQIYGGTLSAQTINLQGGGSNNVGIGGVGAVDVAGPIYNGSAIISGNAEGLSDQTVLTVTASYIQNTGLLEASVNSTLTVALTHANGFANYISGQLRGGTYEALEGGVLNLQTNGTIHSDAATIIFDGTSGSTITSYDPGSASYVPLQQTLGLITQTGELFLDAGLYNTSGNMTVAGDLRLLGYSHFSAGQLYVTGTGHLDMVLSVAEGGQEVTAGRIINSGAIYSDGSGGGVSVINAPVQGTGTITVGPSVTVIDEHMQPITTTATIELTQSVGNTMQFSDGTGTFILDNPSAVTGHFQAFQAGDKIELPTIAYATVTSFSYANNVLTLHEGGASQHFTFNGTYTAADFSLQAGPAGGTTLIGVTPIATS